MGDQELTNALNQLSITDLNKFKTDNAASVSTTLRDGLAGAFIPSLNTAIASANNYDITGNYAIQTQNLATTLDDLERQQSNNINTAKRNTSTASRTREIKEWYYNNKLDTLFVFQLIFISITLVAFLAYLMKLGFIGAGVVGALIGILIVVIILVIANRAIYTDKVRDKRYWSKRNFAVLGSGLPGGTLTQKCT